MKTPQQVRLRVDMAQQYLESNQLTPRQQVALTMFKLVEPDLPVCGPETSMGKDCIKVAYYWADEFLAYDKEHPNV